MNTTLISLALLKVTVDNDGDYLDYFRQFILQILHDNKTAVITDVFVSNKFKDDFGLCIPIAVTTTLLNRLAKKKY